MPRSRSYTFKDSQGELHVMTLQEAAMRIDDIAIRARFNEIIANSKNVRRKKDGFEPGVQPNTGMYAGGRMEYQKQLKDLGLVEIGYDYIPQESVGDYNFCQTEEFIQTCLDSGIDLSGNEQEAIKTGEYFKSVEIE
jgi:hypothetical protein